MPNPNAFTFTIGEKTYYSDPLAVRRILLDKTMGRCWGITRKLNELREKIKTARREIDILQASIAAEPTTQAELEKIAEIQKERAEGKQGTTPFDQLPRVFKLEGYENQIAFHSNQVAELEGTLAAAGYAAFDLDPLDPESGEGITEGEVIETLKSFLEYAEGKGERLGS